MPQLDQTIVFPQIFWFFLIFIIIYSLISYYFLPKFIISIKFRQFILESNEMRTTKLISNLQDKKFTKLKHLNIVLLNLNNNANYLNLQKINNFFINYKLNSTILNNKIIRCIFNNTIYCNNFGLCKINFYPKLLNYKY